MAQQHLDRLTSTDAGFLHQEGPDSHMHIGAVLVFEGPPPPFEELLDHIRSRLHLIPRYRQKLAEPPFGAGRPIWIDDTSFDLSYHVRETAVPAPGTFEQLLLAAARICSTRLDRAKPLWELWLIEGLAPAPGSSVERFALISKTHHSLIDGIAGVDLAAVLFDLGPRADPLDTAELRPWHPQPEPSGAELVISGVRGALNAVLELGERATAAAARPTRSLGRLRDIAQGVGEIAWAVLNPAPETPLNVPIGPHRRFAVVRQRLDDYRAINNHTGTTVNDVVLTAVAGALASWMRARGLRTEGLELRALVPVSVRTGEERGELGNRLTLMRAPLPLYVDDATARLELVSREMRALKRSKQALGASALVAVNDLAPPAVLAASSKLQFSTRLFNLLVTNVPGPQLPLYLLGRRLLDAYPLGFLPENQALAVAVISYNGLVEYGLLGDFDAIPDLDLIAAGLDASLHELLAALPQSPPSPEPAAAQRSAPPLLPQPGHVRRATGPAAEMRAKRGSKTPAGPGRTAPQTPARPGRTAPQKNS